MLSNHHIMKKMPIFSEAVELGWMALALYLVFQEMRAYYSFLLQCLESKQKTEPKLVFRHCFWQCAKSCSEKNGVLQQYYYHDKFVWINVKAQQGQARDFVKISLGFELQQHLSTFKAKCEQLLSPLKVTFQMQHLSCFLQ